MHFQYCVPTGMAEGNVMVMVTVAPAGIQMILKAKKPWGKLPGAVLQASVD
jgi:hypothetical protein